MARRYVMDIFSARELGKGFSTYSWTREQIETWMKEHGMSVTGLSAQRIFRAWSEQEALG